ncbi:MAG TPA: GNAT family N-acetyltransferase [Actinomycetota bacterium]|nr:GNAT family N-acetyltransferase [Actinomycetota bacterium]
MAEGAGRPGGLSGGVHGSEGRAAVSFRLDPPLDEAATRRLVEVWVDVSNAGGAVGFAPPPPEVTYDDVAPVAAAALRSVREGRDHVVVAYEAEEIVGFAFLEHRPGPLFRHWATVKRLQVHPSAQGRGIGRELLRACAEHARELGMEALHLTVRGDTGTESFYEGEGYELVARIPRAIRLSGDDTRDELYMVKRL